MVLTSATLVVWLATISQASPSDGTLTAGWLVSAGGESQSIRDISRTGRPVDASPVEWRGSGPSLSVGYERPGPRRFHRATIDVAGAGSFAYVSPVQRVAASGDDGLSRFEGRYEYRRYPLDDLFMRGLHAGLGVQGIGRRMAYTRSASTFARQRKSATTAAVAWVAAARVDRWARWSADIEWVNGITVSRVSESLDIEPVAATRRSGGGWLTDFSARLSIRLARRSALSLSYLRADEGTIVSRNSYALSRRRLAVGVTYAR